MKTLPTPATHPIIWRKACVKCTKAKRQCTKQVPRCRRCLDKGLQCTYPPPRRPEISHRAGTDGAEPLPSTPPHHTDAAGHSEEDLITGSLDASERPSFDFSGDPVFDFLQMPQHGSGDIPLPAEAEPSTAVPPLAMVASDVPVSLRGAWFLAPESWVAEYTNPPPTVARETEKSLKKYIEQVRLWIWQWVTEGHSPFHHRELYSICMPRHTQDTYTAMAMYMNKTCETEATAHRILQDRVTQLLQDQAAEEALAAAGGSKLSIFDHLSRVQSLLCYQLIRLFDGDIRMCGQAEALIPTLYLWNKQLLESAKGSLAHPEHFLASTPFDVNISGSPINETGSPMFSPKAVWRAWIMAESVRRTWQVASVVQEVYQFLKRGWAECPGRIPSTMRKALWDAPSAYSWMRALSGGRDPLLVPMATLEEVCLRISPAEVDDFNMTIIRIYAMEKVDQWLEEAKYNEPQLISGLESMLGPDLMG